MCLSNMIIQWRNKCDGMTDEFLCVRICMKRSGGKIGLSAYERESERKAKHSNAQIKTKTKAHIFELSRLVEATHIRRLHSQTN